MGDPRPLTCRRPIKKIFFFSRNYVSEPRLFLIRWRFLLDGHKRTTTVLPVSPIFFLYCMCVNSKRYDYYSELVWVFYVFKVQPRIYKTTYINRKKNISYKKNSRVMPVSSKIRQARKKNLFYNHIWLHQCTPARIHSPAVLLRPYVAESYTTEPFQPLSHIFQFFFLLFFASSHTMKKNMFALKTHKDMNNVGPILWWQ